MILRSANQSEAGKISELYESVKGGKFCTWGKDYPTMSEIRQDLESGGLFVLCEGEDIIGAVSVLQKNELDEIPHWKIRSGAYEIARVVVRKSYTGMGMSGKAVGEILNILSQAGAKAVHLAVAKKNIPAYKTYVKLGFLSVGEESLWGNEYFLMEKALCQSTDLQAKSNPQKHPYKNERKAAL